MWALRRITQAGAAWGHAQFRQQSVLISSSRLDEFMQAEIKVFASKQTRRHRRFLDVVGASSSLPKLAQLVHEELPVRFARRLMHMERVNGWGKMPELLELHEMHVQSFRELRLSDASDAANFPQVIFQILERHRRIPTLFAEAVKRIDHKLIEPSEYAEMEEDCDFSLDREAVELWAELFLRSRVSTEMLMSHYLAFLRDASSGVSTKIGIVDRKCDPWQICQQAIAEVQDGPWPCLVEAENVSGKTEFSHVPRYLFYIVDKLLRNSARASFESSTSPSPVQLSLCAAERQVVIRISDRGGGMPSATADRMWCYTVDGLHSKSADSKLQDSPNARPWGVTGQSPIAGRGIGLPLCRLYAMYLGDSLQIVNLPGLGVDAFLFLNRMDLAS
mmetsp:Transcript_31461/g.57112  ORF Transcript_31461/g.57112 Transcript_31461/m.57112 type:complete len:390 (-) Transcript_31461:477-1646(-)